MPTRLPAPEALDLRMARPPRPSPAGGALGVRERKRRAAGHAIGDAAIALVLERGFDDVTVAAIAERAGVSPRTVNNYFPSKQAAVVSVLTRRLVRFTEVWAERPEAEDLWTAVAESITQVWAEDTGWHHQVRAVLAHPVLLREYLAAQYNHEEVLARAIVERLGGHWPTHSELALHAAAVSTATVRSVVRTEVEREPDLAELRHRVLTSLRRVGCGFFDRSS